jgi:hypothetical protein
MFVGGGTVCILRRNASPPGKLSLLELASIEQIFGKVRRVVVWFSPPLIPKDSRYVYLEGRHESMVVDYD